MTKYSVYDYDDPVFKSLQVQKKKTFILRFFYFFILKSYFDLLF